MIGTLRKFRLEGIGTARQLSVSQPINVKWIWLIQNFLIFSNIYIILADPGNFYSRSVMSWNMQKYFYQKKIYREPTSKDAVRDFL